MIYLLLAISTLFTSILSGVLSMAGGMILMGVFSFFLSVPAAMVLHGVAQAFSNGARVWLYRRHICWQVLLPYAIGAFTVLGIFSLITFVPSMALVFILIGSFPLLAIMVPHKLSLNMLHKPTAFLSGLMVTTAQMLAGASGPVLDIFYVQSALSRHQILATKAVTQTLGHIIKLGYYLVILENFGESLPTWVIAAVVSAAVLGNNIARLLVDKINDHQFKTAGRYLIFLIGALYIGKGLHALFF